MQDNITAILTAITVIAALCTVWISRETQRETKKMREAATNPDIAVFLELDSATLIMWAVLRNVGAGPARNVSVTFEGDIPQSERYKLSEVGFFKGIEYVAPGQTLNSVIGTTSSIFGATGFQKSVVIVKFEDNSGRQFTSRYALDTGIFDNVIRLNPRLQGNVIADAIAAASQEIRVAIQEVRIPPPFVSDHESQVDVDDPRPTNPTSAVNSTSATDDKNLG